MDKLETLRSIQIQKISSVHSDNMYMMRHGSVHVEINHRTYTLISILQASSNIQEASDRYSSVVNKNISPRELQQFIEKKILPLFYTKSTTQKKRTFLFESSIVPEQSCNNIADKLKFLYRNSFLYPLLIISISLISIFIYKVWQYFHFSISHIDLYTFGGIILSLFISSLIHEFGHVSACRYFNIKSGNIGFGVYLYIPVFFADVSNIWGLSLKQRIIVNLGGVYFQLLSLIPAILTYLIFQSYLLEYVITFILLNIALVLNPILKFDGYWITSDLLGIPNLRAQSIEFIKYLFKPSKHDISKPKILNLKKGRRFLAIIYSIVSTCFFSYLFIWFIPTFSYDFICSIPKMHNIIELNLSNDLIPYDIFLFLIPKVLITGMFIYQLIKLLAQLYYIISNNIRYLKIHRK